MVQVMLPKTGISLFLGPSKILVLLWDFFYKFHSLYTQEVAWIFFKR